MNRGYVKVWRKIEDSGLIQLPNTLALFMHLLLNATHKDKKMGTPTGVIELKRGQYVSGRIALASKLKQTQQQIRTSLKRLEELEIITIESTNKFSVYTIENYSKYQDDTREDNQQPNQQATNNQPADNQQTTTKQEFNNLNIKEINTPLALLVSMGVSESMAKDWLAVRKLKKLAPTKAAFNKIKNHAEANGYTFMQAVTIACENSWGGFNVDWLAKEKSEPNDFKKDFL
jgi:TolA-binding protein